MRLKYTRTITISVLMSRVIPWATSFRIGSLKRLTNQTLTGIYLYKGIWGWGEVLQEMCCSVHLSKKFFNQDIQIFISKNNYPLQVDNQNSITIERRYAVVRTRFITCSEVSRCPSILVVVSSPTQSYHSCE